LNRHQETRRVTTPGHDNAKRFLGVVLKRGDKRMLRQIVHLVSQGRWDAILDLAQRLKFPAPLALDDLKAVIDPHNKVTDAVVFANRLAANETLRRSVATLAVNDWPGVRALARAEGLEVVEDDLKTLIPESWFRDPGAFSEEAC
jgi:hypothetical protein